MKMLKNMEKGERAWGFPKLNLMSLSSHDNITLLEKILDLVMLCCATGIFLPRTQYEPDSDKEKKNVLRTKR